MIVCDMTRLNEYFILLHQRCIYTQVIKCLLVPSTCFYHSHYCFTQFLICTMFFFPFLPVSIPFLSLSKIVPLCLLSLWILTLESNILPQIPTEIFSFYISFSFNFFSYPLTKKLSQYFKFLCVTAIFSCNNLSQ